MYGCDGLPHSSSTLNVGFSTLETLGIMVAEGIIRVNKNSKSHVTSNLPSLCGEFIQMVMVTKLFQHGTPCLKLEPKRVSWAKALDAECAGPTGENAYILWPCNHLIEK